MNAAVQMLGGFLRALQQRRRRRAFAAEARRQSLAAAECARDPLSDEHVSLKEFAALLDEDDFADEWKA